LSSNQQLQSIEGNVANDDQYKKINDKYGPKQTSNKLGDSQYI